MDKDLRKNFIDCESDINAIINTDQFPVILKVKMALETKVTEKQEPAKKYYKPDAENWERYNEDFKRKIEEIEEEINFEAVTKAIKETAEKNLKEVDKEKKQNYISESTWGKIQTKSQMVEDKKPREEINKLNKEIKREATKDRQKTVLEKFNEHPKDKYKKELWKAVKGLKSKYVPRYIQMRNKEGKHVALKDRAEAIADNLEKERWHNEEVNEGPSRAKHIEHATINTEEFTIEE